MKTIYLSTSVAASFVYSFYKITAIIDKDKKV